VVSTRGSTLLSSAAAPLPPMHKPYSTAIPSLNMCRSVQIEPPSPPFYQPGVPPGPPQKQHNEVTKAHPLHRLLKAAQCFPFQNSVQALQCCHHQPQHVPDSANFLCTFSPTKVSRPHLHLAN
jgi:hypothetical protein